MLDFFICTLKCKMYCGVKNCQVLYKMMNIGFSVQILQIHTHIVIYNCVLQQCDIFELNISRCCHPHLIGGHHRYIPTSVIVRDIVIVLKTTLR